MSSKHKDIQIAYPGSIRMRVSHIFTTALFVVDLYMVGPKDLAGNLIWRGSPQVAQILRTCEELCGKELPKPIFVGYQSVEGNPDRIWVITGDQVKKEKESNYRAILIIRK